MQLPGHVGGGRGSRQAEATTPSASLVNTYWKPVELDNQPVALGAGKNELNMVLVSEGNGVRAIQAVIASWALSNRKEASLFSGRWHQHQGRVRKEWSRK